jgi:cell division protein FtsQ
MKPSNRRKNRQQYLLEVKVQDRGRMRARLRLVCALGAAALALMMSCYGLYRLAGWAVDRLVYKNPRFAIAQIVVENDGVLNAQRVAQFAGVRVGENLLAVDLEQVRRNLEMIPLVRRVEVRRVLPNQLFIRLEERVAVARLRLPGSDPGESVFYIDREGVVMKPLKLADGTMLQPLTPRPAPWLSGLSPGDLRVGRRAESEQVYLAIALIDKLEQSVAGTMLEVEQIDLSRPRQLVVRTREHTVVQFDVEDFSRQLRRLGAILHWAQQRQKQLASVDLTVARGVPVTFAN